MVEGGAHGEGDLKTYRWWKLALGRNFQIGSVGRAEALGWGVPGDLRSAWSGANEQGGQCRYHRTLQVIHSMKGEALQGFSKERMWSDLGFQSVRTYPQIPFHSVLSTVRSLYKSAAEVICKAISYWNEPSESCPRSGAHNERLLMFSAEKLSIRCTVCHNSSRV